MLKGLHMQFKPFHMKTIGNLSLINLHLPSHTCRLKNGSSIQIKIPNNFSVFTLPPLFALIPKTKRGRNVSNKMIEFQWMPCVHDLKSWMGITSRTCSRKDELLNHWHTHAHTLLFPRLKLSICNFFLLFTLFSPFLCHRDPCHTLNVTQEFYLAYISFQFSNLNFRFLIENCFSKLLGQSMDFMDSTIATWRNGRFCANFNSWICKWWGLPKLVFLVRVNG